MFYDDEFETDKQIRQSEIREGEIIGIDGIEGDITLSADLGIGSARPFEVQS